MYIYIYINCNMGIYGLNLDYGQDGKFTLDGQYHMDHTSQSSGIACGREQYGQIWGKHHPYFAAIYLE